MPNGTTLTLVPTDRTLVCYGLDANGVHGPTPGVMRDEFEGTNYSPTLKQQVNSSVVISVFHIPTGAQPYYSYTVDVTIPATPSSVTCSTAPGDGKADCNFALLEGFDTGVFATNSGNSDEGWCLGSVANGTSCVGFTFKGGINLNYATAQNLGVAPLKTGASPTTVRFVVKRYFASGVSSLPAGNDPVVLAALFSPFDLDENYISDNVAAGYTNTPPSVVQNDGAWTTFSSGLAALSEGTNSGTLSFNATDTDTAGAISAAVTLNLGGLSVPVTPTCNSTGSGPVNATCSFSLGLANPSWWDASVASQYLGQGNVFATDPGGVGASASIVVIDGAGKASAPVNVPIHVASTVNNAPTLTFGGAFANASDPNNNHIYPTYSCSVSAGAGAGGCGSGRGTIYVDLANFLTGAGGPAAAFDELATQTTAVVPYSDPQDSYTNVQCNREQGAMVFVTDGGPVVTQGASANVFDVNFVIPSTPPASTVGVLCAVTLTDANFPNGQTANTASTQFRIAIKP